MNASEDAMRFAIRNGWKPELQTRPVQIQARYLRPGDRTDFADQGVSRISDADPSTDGASMSVRIDGYHSPFRIKAADLVTIHIL